MRPALVALLVVGLSAARAASAAPPDEAQRKGAARRLADHAYELYSAGDYPGAIAAFQEADRTYHAPTLLYGLAKAHVKAHHLVAAKALFQQVIAEPIPPEAPDEFRGAQTSSKEELRAVLAILPSIEVRLRGVAPAGGVEATIDDKPAALGTPVDVDVGKHDVALAGAQGKASRTVEVVEGVHLVVDLDLGAVPATTERPSIVPGAVALGIGGAGLIVGIAAGVVTLKQASSIKSGCPNGVCPASDMSKVASANAVSAASTAGFVIAGVGAVVGTVLLVVRAKADATPAVSATFGPGSILFRGHF